MDVRTTRCANDNGQNNKGSQSGSNNNYGNNVEEGDNHHGDEENNIFLREPITPTSIRQRFGQPMREGRRVSPPISSTAIGSGEQHLIHQYQQQLKKCDGIRSLSVNPSKTLLAVGLADPPVVMVYRLSDFTPMGITVRDHRDAVFSVQWLDDSTFVTGSRDGSLGLWKCNNNDYVNITKDGLEKVPRLWSSNNDEYASRIRDTKLIGSTTAASLAANGIVQIWDLNQRQKVFIYAIKKFNKKKREKGEGRRKLIIFTSHFFFINSKKISNYGIPKSLYAWHRNNKVEN